MSRRKNRAHFECHLLPEDAKRLRRLAQQADVSASKLVTRVVEVIIRKARCGCVGLDGSLCESSKFVTAATDWQSDIEGSQQPGGAYLEIDLARSQSRFGSAKRKHVSN